MVDLEKLAIKRDRGYLVRLIIFMVFAAFGGVFVFNYLTGSSVSGCMTDAFYGGVKGEKK
jgi:hypothetical protein